MRELLRLRPMPAAGCTRGKQTKTSTSKMDKMESVIMQIPDECGIDVDTIISAARERYDCVRSNGVA
jgi:hypothetical protein